MRNYTPKSKKEYYLEHNLYMQILYMIRGYKNLKDRYYNIIHESPPPPDGMPRNNKIGNPTEHKALTCAFILEQLIAIEQTIFELKAKYNNTYTDEEFDAHSAFMDYGAFCYYRSKKKRNISPHRSTWNAYRREFCYGVANRLNFF